MLHGSLTANAIFSTLTGFVLLAKSDWVATHTGLPDHVVLPITGAGLLAWALLVAGLARLRTPPPRWVVGVSLGDLAWVIATAVGLLFWGHQLTGVGVMLLIIIAGCVGGFAAGQLMGLQRLSDTAPMPQGTPQGT